MKDECKDNKRQKIELGITGGKTYTKFAKKNEETKKTSKINRMVDSLVHVRMYARIGVCVCVFYLCKMLVI